MTQNGERFLEHEKKVHESKRDRAKDDGNRDKVEEHQACVDILQCLSKCACRKLPGNLAAQKLEQNRKFAQALSKRPGETAVVYGELQGRLIVNLSDSLIQNAGICLDRNTGLPYIPGSAVKGVARHAALSHLRDGGWTIGEFMHVFGSSEADFRDKGELSGFVTSVPEKERTLKGGVDFLSAQPITEPTIVVDISNVHYPKYYQSGDVHDLANENPKPNTFPVVEKGVRYAFCIVENGKTVDGKLFEKAKSVLIEAITVSGVGAKTGAGYGWFKDVTEIMEAEVKREAEAAEAQRAEAEAKAKREAELVAIEAEARRRAELSPFERILESWNNQPNLKAIVKGRYIAQFVSCSDDEKKGIVEVLRMPDGIGARVWAVLKGTSPEDSKKKFWNRTVEQAIRAYCRNTLKLGKMP
ncbi:MAG: type III-B CRISPR module RAMP protein Cmr6 [Kiritimatiellae bacterium]|nr:type III-B CRISPR module RAMP protein Cmr6 [Kiritimatiellia bacterium]